MRRAVLVAGLVFGACYPQAYPPAPQGHAFVPQGEPFGYVTAGLQVLADYGGEIDLESGRGWRFTVPPLVPVVIAADLALMCGVYAVHASGDVYVVISPQDLLFLVPPDDPTVWTSGLRQRGALLSELSWELTAEGSYHGPDQALRLLGGLKFAANRESRVRLYASAGWSWHWIGRGLAEDVTANGPYAGAGIELFANPNGCVGLDGRWHWVSGENGEEANLLTVELSWSVHW